MRVRDYHSALSESRLELRHLPEVEEFYACESICCKDCGYELYRLI